MFYNSKITDFNGKKIQVLKYKDTKIKSTNDKKTVNANNDDLKKDYSLEYAYKVKRRIYDYANSNDFRYFATFTFKPSFETNEQRFDAMHTWLQSQSKRARRTGQEFKYIIVPELHENGLVHFHALFCDTFDLKIKETKENRYSVGCWKNGFSDISVIKDKEACSNYISKYITKSFCTDKQAVAKFKKKYWASKNLKRGSTAYIEAQEQEQEENVEKAILEFIEQKASYSKELKNCTLYELSEQETQEFLEKYASKLLFEKNRD